MTSATTADLDILADTIRTACEAAGEPISWFDRTIDWHLAITGDPGWSLQVAIPHAAPNDPEITLGTRRVFNGHLTAGAWAALDAVRAWDTAHDFARQMVAAEEIQRTPPDRATTEAVVTLGQDVSFGEDSER